MSLAKIGFLIDRTLSIYLIVRYIIVYFISFVHKPSLRGVEEKIDKI